MKRSVLVRKPKGKGNQGEREVIEILKAHGYPARRNFASGGYGGSDIIGGPEGYALEVKRQERLNIWKALEQSEEAAAATETPLVIFRRSRKPWYVALPKDDYESLWIKAGQPPLKADYCSYQKIRIWDCIEESPILMFFQQRFPDQTVGRWYATLPFEDLLGLIKGQEGTG